MKSVRIFAVVLGLGALSLGSAFAYTNSFTLNFNASGDTAGWSDPVNTSFSAPTLAAGETTAADSPAYSPAPSDVAAGFNGTGWFRAGASTADNYGITTLVYDGTAGGSTTDPADYAVEADVFVMVHASYRMQTGIFVRWTAARANTPIEFFHAVNVTSQSNGYGVRGGGITSQYGLAGFPVETENRWVHMKMDMQGSVLTVSVDRDRDGTYDYTATPDMAGLAANANVGKPGVFCVINDPNNGSAGLTTQFAYFDNFHYYFPAGVQDWTLY